MTMPEPVQLRGTPPGSPLLVVRGGVNALDDEIVRRAATLTRAKWGFDGISVFEVPNGDFGELCTPSDGHVRTAPHSHGLRQRCAPRRVSSIGHRRTALHWTIVLPDVEHETLDRLRSVFSPPHDNPGFRRRT